MAATIQIANLGGDYRYGHEGVDDNVEFDEDRDGSTDDKDIDVDEI